MKASIGNTMILNIVIIFMFLTIALLIASIAFSKAYKVKNRIVDIIEKYDSGYEGNGDAINNEINEVLSKAGYRIVTGYKSCPNDEDLGRAINENNRSYDYCIYKGSSRENSVLPGVYYKVRVYMYFDVPVLGDFIKIPITGETKIFYSFDYEERE